MLRDTRPGRKWARIQNNKRMKSELPGHVINVTYDRRRALASSIVHRTNTQAYKVSLMARAYRLEYLVETRRHKNYLTET
jgi:hypothetical protein